jgi:CBS domain-containing protein
MPIKDIMTGTPACCTSDSSLREVAELMVRHDCGMIPVVDSKKSMKPLGVVTDRDIVCRIVAEGKNPLEATAADCMSAELVTLPSETEIEQCLVQMEKHKVRRILVVDKGKLVGVVAQADIATDTSSVGEVVEAVSEPSVDPTVH